jgi:hypothetical protein
MWYFCWILCVASVAAHVHKVYRVVYLYLYLSSVCLTPSLRSNWNILVLSIVVLEPVLERTPTTFVMAHSSYEILWQRKLAAMFSLNHYANPNKKGCEWCWPICFDTLFYSTDCVWHCKFCKQLIFSCKHRRLAACHAGFVVQTMTSKLCLWPTVCE